MRKHLLLFIVCLFSIYSSFATPVDEATALSIASQFITKRPSAISGKLSLHVNNAPVRRVATANEESPAYYIYNAGDNEGFVIISADDCAHPILGYSDEGHFDMENMPDNMRKWLFSYENMIHYAQENGISADEETSAEWKEWLSGSAKKKASVVVSPLLATKWNQAAPYNDLCPYDAASGNKTPTGCVATAMAQVMYYWQYPKKGTSYHSYVHDTYGTLSANFASTTYDWSNMTKTYSSSSTTAQNKAVATLMYHCGVATDMNYGPSANGGSGTFIVKDYCNTGKDNAEYALKTYFGYKVASSGIKDYNISSSKWVTLLKQDLDAKRPVIYGGFGQGGHCFVCDGYNSEDYFHFNWGWGGSYNGYFKLDALNPGPGGIGGGSYSYNDNQMAIFGLQPKEKTDPEGGSGSTTEPTYDLRMYSNIETLDSICYFDTLRMSANIANYSDEDITATFAAVLFDGDGNFYCFIDSIRGELSSLRYFNYQAEYPGQASFTPGVYYVAYFYHTDDQGWTIIDDGDYSNIQKVTVYYLAGIETYSDFNLLEGAFVTGEDVTIHLDIANIFKAKEFKGSLRVSLSYLEDGSFAQNIDIIENKTIPALTYDSCVFKGNITVDPGTYLMEMAYMEDADEEEIWYYGGSWFYSNPVRVVVAAPEIMPDMYENNNTEETAFNISLTYNNNTAGGYLVDPNIHNGSDVDYYAIALPEGFNYNVQPRFTDAMQSEDYTLTGSAVYYSTSSAVQQSITNTTDISIEGGNTLYIKVFPMLSGGKGTYGMRLDITRSAIPTDIETTESGANDTMYIDPLGRIVKPTKEGKAKNVKVVYPIQ